MKVGSGRVLNTASEQSCANCPTSGKQRASDMPTCHVCGSSTNSAGRPFASRAAVEQHALATHGATSPEEVKQRAERRRVEEERRERLRNKLRLRQAERRRVEQDKREERLKKAIEEEKRRIFRPGRAPNDSRSKSSPFPAPQQIVRVGNLDSTEYLVTEKANGERCWAYCDLEGRCSALRVRHFLGSTGTRQHAPRDLFRHALFLGNTEAYRGIVFDAELVRVGQRGVVRSLNLYAPEYFGRCSYLTLSKWHPAVDRCQKP